MLRVLHCGDLRRRSDAQLDNGEARNALARPVSVTASVSMDVRSQGQAAPAGCSPRTLVMETRGAR